MRGVRVEKKNLTSFDGTEIFYTINTPEKSSMTIVFLHGIAANWTVWKREISYFSRRGYSTIALDFRGHGRSNMPPEAEKYRPPCFSRDIYEVLKHEGVQNFVLVGHSLGGAIAINYCMGHKHKYPRSLILIESTATYPFKHNDLLHMGPFVSHLLRFVARHKKTRQEHFAHLDAVDLSCLDFKAGVKEVLHLLHLTPIRSIVKTLDNVERYVHKNKVIIERTLKNLHIPTLLIAGANDDIIPPKYSQHIKDLDKSAELTILKNAGHRCIIEHSGKISHVIEAFLKNSIP